MGLDQNQENQNVEKNEAQAETIRVNVELLNELMIYAGELVLTRNQLMRLTSDLTKKIPGLNSVLQDIDLTTSTLQEKIMNTRMQPLSLVFSRFPRMIRDIMLQNNKKIKMETTGNDINLDKSVIENLFNPLSTIIHYIASKVIENPVARNKKGKDEFGRILLKAYQEGGKVNIDVIDDGESMESDHIIQDCLERQLVADADAVRMNRKEIHNLIFRDGYTRFNARLEEGEQETSLYEAKLTLEKIGGTITVESDYGKHNIINIKLPLTLVIIPSIIVTVQKLNFAIPQVSLQEIVRLQADDKEHRIEMVNNSPVLRLRNKLLPILYLSDVLTLPRIPSEDGATRIMVLQHDENEFGLVVDEIFDHEEIVVKTIPHFFKNTPCYSGTTIMGDGSVALILDVGGISAKGKLDFGGMKEHKNEMQEETKQDDIQSLLLFENANNEYFAFNLDLIKRIEKVKINDIEKVGSKEYMEHEGKSMRIVRLEEFLPVRVPETETEEVYVIIPKLVETPIGIMCRQIIDSMQVSVVIDVESITAKGMIGSALIKGMLVLFPDIYELIEMADPEKAVTYRVRKDKKYKMLLVEDTPFFRSLEKNYFESAGFQVDIAFDGLDGIKKAQTGSYDILVVDIIMPRMDGYEFMHTIRKDERYKKTPAMALTTLSNEESKEKAIQVGFDAYEIKIHKERLLETIKTLLTQSKE